MNEINQIRLTFAVVIRGSVQDIERLQEHLSHFQVVYQKVSGSKLMIVEEGE